MNALKELFRPELVFFESASEREEVFKNVSEHLLAEGLVKEDYLQALLDRENQYPTGIDLSVIDADLPNIAIPHTDPNYCFDQCVAVVKLKNEVPFHNMMNPETVLPVKFLFVILNHAGSEQTTILSSLMTFFGDKERVLKLTQLEDASAIYQYISEEIQ